MNSLQNIPVKVENAGDCSIGNLGALMSEIAAHLERLLHDGRTGSIDLHGLPFAPGEHEQLRLLLGAGEVSARMEALGPSEIIETRYPGVWRVTHYNVEGDIVADGIEIAPVPAILKSQAADIQQGLALLRARINGEAQP